jgi:hypothetical protein
MITGAPRARSDLATSVQGPSLSLKSRIASSGVRFGPSRRLGARGEGTGHIDSQIAQIRLKSHSDKSLIFRDQAARHKRRVHSSLTIGDRPTAAPITARVVGKACLQPFATLPGDASQEIGRALAQMPRGLETRRDRKSVAQSPGNCEPSSTLRCGLFDGSERPRASTVPEGTLSDQVLRPDDK